MRNSRLEGRLLMLSGGAPVAREVRGPGRGLLIAAGRGLLVAAGVALASSAPAVEVYYQPLAAVTAETDSNLDLDPGVRHRVEGYLVDLATVIGIDTPNWTTMLRPRIDYRYYPQEKANDRLEAYLDFNTNYRTQRSTASVTGSFEHLDEFNAEFGSAQFNDINPVQPTPDTGKVTVGATRDSALLYPKYTYNFSPTISGGFAGQYQLVNYSPSDDRSHVDFEYYQGRAFAGWFFTDRSQVSVGAIGSKYQAKQFPLQATGSGATVDLTTSWTPLLTTRAEILFQHTSIDDSVPTVFQTQVSKVGGSVDTTYKTQIAQFRLIARRSVVPSGAGGVYLADRLQFQYDRSVTARLGVTGAVLGVHTVGLTSNLETQNRKYAQTIVEARYALTARWFLQGGYMYAWQKYENAFDSAANNRIYLQFGYAGLGQQK